MSLHFPAGVAPAGIASSRIIKSLSTVDGYHAPPRTQRAWHNQFSRFGRVDMPAEILALVASGAIADESWGNDVCPSFGIVPCRPVSDAEDVGQLRVWVDFPNPADRECAEHKRFAVSDADATETELLSTDDVNEVVALVQFLRAPTAERWAHYAIKQIKADDAAGRFPFGLPRTFSGLHDYVDANLYGFNETLLSVHQAPDDERGLADCICAASNRGSDLVDAWLASR